MFAASNPRVGVLALQGAFIEHEAAFRQAGMEVFEIRQPKDLSGKISALVFPGGESTVQRKLLDELGLRKPLWQLIDSGLPVFATCAGLILLAKEVDGQSNEYGRLDISVKRNAYGRQLGSFCHHGEFADQGIIPMTFIRAPAIVNIQDSVEILSYFNSQPTAVRQGNIVGLAWHPELNAEPVLPKLLGKRNISEDNAIVS